jgi:hypothetical protein
VTFSSAGSSQPVCFSHWQSVGPFGVRHSVAGLSTASDPEDIGAIHSVWTAGDLAFVAAVNGGVWRSKTFHAYDSLGGPHWSPGTDALPCASMAAVSGSAADPTVAVAGCGYRSNSAQRGGEAMGAMVTTDGGDSWRMTTFPKGYAISAVLAAGSGASAALLVATCAPVKPLSGATGEAADPYGLGTKSGGIWHSTDAGLSFRGSHQPGQRARAPPGRQQYCLCVHAE